MTEHTPTDDAAPLNATVTYTIEALDSDGQTWDRSLVGNGSGYPSMAAAEAAIQSLRDMGGDWSAGAYRIVEDNEDWPPLGPH